MTLVEILIVISLLGILAALVVPHFANATDRAALTSAQSQLRAIRTQIELYRGDNQGVVPNLATAQWVNFVDASQNPQGHRYLQQAPRNPLRDNATGVVAGDETYSGAAAGEAWVWDHAERQIYAIDALGDVLIDPSTGNPF